MHNDYENLHNMHAAHYAREHNHQIKTKSTHIGWRILGATAGLAGSAAALSSGMPQAAGTCLWFAGYALFSQDY